MIRQRADLVVAGLGAMGAATVWRAARQGLTVAGIDARRPPHAEGSTHGHSRIIREAYFEHPQYVPLVRRAYALWAELEAESRTRLFQPTGGLMMGAPDGPVVSGTLRAAAEHGLAVETWSGDEIRRRVESLQPAAGMVGVYEPRAGVLAPERAVSAMLDGAARAGATLVTSEPVLGWDPEAEGVAVRTPEREIVARWLILAAGAWVPSLTQGLVLPLAVERQVQYWYPRAEGCFRPERFPVFLVEGPGGRMLYGLPDQGRGLKLAEHHGGAVGATPDVVRAVSADERARFHEFAREWLRPLPGEPAEAAVCLYTNTPDGDFLLDRHPECAAVYICSACSGHGFKFAPAIGEAVLAELAGTPPAVDLTPFRLSRFARG